MMISGVIYPTVSGDYNGFNYITIQLAQNTSTAYYSQIIHAGTNEKRSVEQNPLTKKEISFVNLELCPFNTEFSSIQSNEHCRLIAENKEINTNGLSLYSANNEIIDTDVYNSLDYALINKTNKEEIQNKIISYVDTTLPVLRDIKHDLITGLDKIEDIKIIMSYY